MTENLNINKPVYIKGYKRSTTIARGAIPVPYLTATTPQRPGLSPRQQDWLWAMSIDKVYGFDTEVTLLKCVSDLMGQCYKLAVL